MRKSSKGLLRTYLGDGPSEAVWNGTIKRGERTTIEAVVMFCDLRGFTAMSDSSSQEQVFEALNGYFDLVVQSVEENGGDVLKFIGDGILSIFPISDPADRAKQCRNAARAAQDAMAGLAALNLNRNEAGQPSLDFGVGIDAGRVSYGNIGSPGRLDFTVLGGAVNIASRIEGLTKTTGSRILATTVVAAATPDLFSSCGPFEIRGLADPIELFTPIEPSN
ncbi:adenylate/guanylate cyclase domain-containing protein [Roseovarius rhodophyticola]|uniref:Adenylate/guanylate cyclase domain-containing protein n=1 Tax=Roseovarius rhodophyticola TaxID=3080827 RepID=A0ABZ2TC92_9RHOB|nr:adenylate/guanylate cyclase domain-containing protein [Roseovarius sp. W115]